MKTIGVAAVGMILVGLVVAGAFWLWPEKNTRPTAGEIDNAVDSIGDGDLDDWLEPWLRD